MKIWLLLFTLLFARENPFEPVVKPLNQKIVKREIFHKTKLYLPDDARVLKKVIFVYQTLNGDIKKKEVLINKDIDFHYPFTIIHKYVAFHKKYLKFANLFSLEVDKREIKIFTKDKKIRSFFLVSPFRIIVDFVRDANFLTISKNLNTYLKKVVVGNHDGYYRVVFYFDANYNYKIKKFDKGYKIELQ